MLHPTPVMISYEKSKIHDMLQFSIGEKDIDMILKLLALTLNRFKVISSNVDNESKLFLLVTFIVYKYLNNSKVDNYIRLILPYLSVTINDNNLEDVISKAIIALNPNPNSAREILNSMTWMLYKH